MCSLCLTSLRILFPACAGVILSQPVNLIALCAVPRMRGGDPWV